MAHYVFELQAIGKKVDDDGTETVILDVHQNAPSLDRFAYKIMETGANTLSNIYDEYGWGALAAMDPEKATASRKLAVEAAKRVTDAAHAAAGR